ncbi:MAG: hypothetical protein IJ537_02195 [Bacteroidaceae bacterium]|nr:hypothetical protein [Bacteroidaceae bacterium]
MLFHKIKLHQTHFTLYFITLRTDHKAEFLARYLKQMWRRLRNRLFQRNW